MSWVETRATTLQGKNASMDRYADTLTENKDRRERSLERLLGSIRGLGQTFEERGEAAKGREFQADLEGTRIEANRDQAILESGLNERSEAASFSREANYSDKVRTGENKREDEIREAEWTREDNQRISDQAREDRHRTEDMDYQTAREEAYWDFLQNHQWPHELALAHARLSDGSDDIDKLAKTQLFNNSLKIAGIYYRDDQGNPYWDMDRGGIRGEFDWNDSDQVAGLRRQFQTQVGLLDTEYHVPLMQAFDEMAKGMASGEGDTEPGGGDAGFNRRSYGGGGVQIDPGEITYDPSGGLGATLLPPLGLPSNIETNPLANQPGGWEAKTGTGAPFTNQYGDSQTGWQTVEVPEVKEGGLRGVFGNEPVLNSIQERDLLKKIIYLLADPDVPPEVDEQLEKFKIDIEGPMRVRDSTLGMYEAKVMEYLRKYAGGGE